LNNSFIINIIAKLNKQLSKSSINGDLKSFDDKMYIRVIAKLSKALSRRELNKQLKELKNLYVNVGTKIKTDKGEKAKLKKNIKMLQQQIQDIEIGLSASKLKQERLNAEIENIRKNAQSKISSEPLEFSLQIKKDKLISDIEYTGKRYSKLFSSVSASKKYKSIMQSALSISNKGQLADARAELSAFTSELKAAGLASKSTGDRWRDLTSRAKDLFSAASIIRVAFEQLQNSVKTAIELDKVYTDLIKVQQDLTRNDYPEFLDQCNKKAQELATTQKALIEGATEFSKSDYDLATSDKLTEKSTILSNVGEMSASDSAKAIISGVQAYDTVDGYTDVVDKAQALIDKYNELGNTASITTAELAQGVQSVGSVFADANTNVDHFLSLLSAGNRQYQDADSLALALRTSALRIRGASVELEEAGEDIEGVMSTLENQKAIKALTGVDILESDQKTIRSIYDIYLDISKVYKDMSDTDQSALLDILAGKHRASAISATLNNMTEAEKLLQKSLNSAGSAQKEYDKYLESTEAHINQFKAKVTESYSELINGETISFISDIGTALLDIINKTDIIRHTLIAIGTIKIGQGISAIGGVIANTTKQMNVLGNAIQQVKELPLDDVLKTRPLIEIGEATKSLTDKNLKLLLSQKNLKEQDRILILQQHNLTEEEALAKLEKMGLTSATNANTAANTANAGSVTTLKGAFTGLTASIKATWSAMSSLQKISIIFTAISSIRSVASSVIDSSNQAQEEARQKALETAQASMEEANNLEDLYIKYKQLQSVQNRTEEQEQTYKQTIEDVTKALGDKKSALKGLKEGTDEYTKALEKASKEELKAAWGDAKGGAKSAKDEALNKAGFNNKNPFVWDLEAVTGGITESNSKAAEIVFDNIYSKYLIGGLNKYTNNNIDDLVDYYLLVKKSKEEIEQLDDASQLDTKFYESLSKVYSDLSESVEKYIGYEYEALKREYEIKLNDGAPPATADEYEKLKSSVLFGLGWVSNEHKDAVKDLLEQDFSDLISGFDSVNESADQAAASTEELNKVLDKLGDRTDEKPYGNLSEDNPLIPEIDRLTKLVQEEGGGFVASDGSKDFTLSLLEATIQTAAFIDQNMELEDSLSSLQSEYDSVSKALSQYAEDGYLSADSLDAILSLSDQTLNTLVDENGVLAGSAEKWDALTIARLEEMKAATYQNAAEEITRINSLSAAEATNELAKANGTLTETAYAAAQAELTKARSMGGAYAELADNVWNATSTRIALIDAQLSAISSKTYSPSVDYSGSKKSDKSSSKSEKQLDFFDYRLKEYEEAVDSFKAHLENLTGAKAKNIVIDDIIKVQSLKQSDLQKGIDMYRKQADELFNKIPAEYREAAKNGALAVVDFVEASSDGNDTIAETIENYRDLSEKVSGYETQLEELNKELRDLQKQKFDNTVNDFEKLLDVISVSADKLNDLIDLQEKQYGTSSAKFYDELTAQEKERLRLLNEEKSALEAQMRAALESRTVKYGSDEWQEMNKTIQDINSGIIESTGLLEEYQDAVNDIHWENFDEFLEQTNSIYDELNNLADLLGRSDLFKTNKAVNASALADIFNISRDSNELDFGVTEWTDAGIASLGSYAQALQAAQYNLEKVSDEIAGLDEAYNRGKYSLEEYSKKHDELLDSQWQEIDNINSAKDAIKDLYDNYIDAQIDAIDKETGAYSKLIEKQKESLQKLLDENNAQKELAETKKNLTDINAQITAMSGDTSDAGIARRLKLEEELSDKQKDYNNRQYEKNIADRQNALDEENELFSQAKEKEKTALEESKNDTEKVIKDMSDFALQNADIVFRTMAGTSQQYGIRISESITRPWLNGINALAGYDSNLRVRTGSFLGQLEAIRLGTLNVQNQADATAVQLIATFGVSSAALQGELNSVSIGLQTDIDKANSLYSQFSSLFSADGLDTSGLIGSLNEVGNAVNNVSGAVTGLGNNLDNLNGKTVDVNVNQNVNQNVNTALDPLYHDTYNPATGQFENNNYNSLGRVGRYKIVNPGGALIEDLGEVPSVIAQAKLKELQSKNNNYSYRLQSYASGGTVTEKDGIKMSSPLSNGDDRFVAVKPGEGILTQLQNDAWQNLSKITPQLNTYLTDLVKKPTVDFVKRPAPAMNYTAGDIIINGSMDNVTLKQVEKVVNKNINDAFDKFTRAALR